MIIYCELHARHIYYLQLGDSTIILTSEFFPLITHSFTNSDFWNFQLPTYESLRTIFSII